MARKPKTRPRSSDESDPLMDPARFTDNPFYAIIDLDGKVHYDPSLDPAQIEIIERRNGAVAQFMETGDRKAFDDALTAIDADARRYQREKK